MLYLCSFFGGQGPKYFLLLSLFFPAIPIPTFPYLTSSKYFATHTAHRLVNKEGKILELFDSTLLEDVDNKE